MEAAAWARRRRVDSGWLSLASALSRLAVAPAARATPATPAPAPAPATPGPANQCPTHARPWPRPGLPGRPGRCPRHGTAGAVHHQPGGLQGGAGGRWVLAGVGGLRTRVTVALQAGTSWTVRLYQKAQGMKHARLCDYDCMSVNLLDASMLNVVLAPHVLLLSRHIVACFLLPAIHSLHARHLSLLQEGRPRRLLWLLTLLKRRRSCRTPTGEGF